MLKNFLLPKHISRDEIYRSIKEILVPPIVRGGVNVTGFRTVNVTESEETVNRSVCYYRNNQVHVLFGASDDVISREPAAPLRRYVQKDSLCKTDLSYKLKILKLLDRVVQ